MQNILLRCFGQNPAFGLVVYNDTAQVLTELAGDRHEVARPGGAATMVFFPLPGGSDDGELIVQAGACSYTCQFGADLVQHHPRRQSLRRAFPVQVEPDFRLYAVPPDAKCTTPLADMSGGWHHSPQPR